MTTKRIITLAAVGALATVSTVAISMSTWLSVGADPAGDVIRLHIPSTGVATFTHGDDIQKVEPKKNSCVVDEVNNPYTVMDLSAAGTSTQAIEGIANFGIGVKASNSSGNGNPCAQTDVHETLSLTPGSTLTGSTFSKVSLDLEMTGNAVVKLRLGNGSASDAVFTLLTGNQIVDPAETAELEADPTPNDIVTDSADPTDGCAAFNSSNPNSSGSDNCQWTVDPGFTFSQIRLTTTNGTVALEGGGDFGNDSAHDSLFFLDNSAPVAVDDEATLLFGDDDVTIDVLGNDSDPEDDDLSVVDLTQPAHGTATPNPDGTVTYTPAAGWSGDDSFTYRASDGAAVSNIATVTVRTCSGPEVGDDDPTGVTGTFTQINFDPTVCKVNTVTLELNAESSSILFEPNGDGGDPVDYRGVISFGPKTATIAGNGALQLLLNYDRDGDGTDFTPTPVPLCIEPEFDGDLVTNATFPMPSGDTWCIASESTQVEELGTRIITTWQVFGKDDPRFS